ncbi:flagellar hook-basal body complex protein FliE [Brevundimonas sp.]|uniref:flagellar hook-basal body complex protein FliE n=1 Tax=Brevundimonas sp. TaxID=1871086 RepID=UPI0025E13D0F|nr:flagellar hook-basal body complex protein FliE [Brevundimonas sp.]
MDPMAAIRAYTAAQGAGQPTAAGGAAAPGFDEMLRGFMGDAVQASRAAEGQMAAHVNGQADLVSVVTAIASAEASLETVVAVRDQVIQAYQEIMRMPI